MPTNKISKKSQIEKLSSPKKSVALTPEDKLESEYNFIADQLNQLSLNYNDAVAHAEKSTDELLKLEQQYLIDKAKLEELLGQADVNRVEVIKNSSNIEWTKADLAASISQKEAKKAIMIEEELVAADERKKQLREHVKAQAFNITKLSMSHVQNNAITRRKRYEISRLAEDNLGSIRSSLISDRLGRLERRRSDTKELNHDLTKEIQIIKSNSKEAQLKKEGK